VSKQSEPNSKTPSAKEGLTEILISCAVDGKLVTLIKEQLAGSDVWDLTELYTSLNESDR